MKKIGLLILGIITLLSACGGSPGGNGNGNGLLPPTTENKLEIIEGELAATFLNYVPLVEDNARDLADEEDTTSEDTTIYTIYHYSRSTSSNNVVVRVRYENAHIGPLWYEIEFAGYTPLDEVEAGEPLIIAPNWFGIRNTYNGKLVYDYTVSTDRETRRITSDGLTVEGVALNFDYRQHDVDGFVSGTVTYGGKDVTAIYSQE